VLHKGLEGGVGQEWPNLGGAVFTRHGEDVEIASEICPHVIQNVFHNRTSDLSSFVSKLTQRADYRLNGRQTQKMNYFRHKATVFSLWFDVLKDLFYLEYFTIFLLFSQGLL